MDSHETYVESYEYINKLCSTNTTDAIAIDYRKLDCNTQAELRDAIGRVLTKRKREIYNNILSGPHTY